MPLQLPNFAAPSAQDTYPFLQYLSQALANNQSIMKFPSEMQLLQAQANAKNTYANFLPAQIYSTLLSNPKIQEMLPQSQITAMANALQGYMQPSKTAATSGGGLLSSLGKLISGGDALAPQGASAAGNMTQPGLPGVTAPATDTQDAGTTDASMQGTGTGFSPATRTASGIANPGNRAAGGYSLLNVADAQAKGLATNETETAKAQAIEWSDKNKKAADLSDKSNETIRQLNNFDAAYENLNKYERGTLLGIAPAVTPQSQDADRAAQTLMTARIRALQSQHITDSDFRIGEKLKVGRYLLPESKKHALDFDKGVAMRDQERLPFNIRAQSMGYTTQQADAAWNNYINEKPFYNAKSNTLITKNLKQWPEYLTQEKMAEALDPIVQMRHAKRNAPNADEDNMTTTEEPATSKRAASTPKLRKGEKLPDPNKELDAEGQAISRKKFIGNQEYHQLANGQWRPVIKG